MILAVDIGNTTIGFALMNSRGSMMSVTKIDTMDCVRAGSEPAPTFKKTIQKIFKNNSISQAIICSVVPEALAVVEGVLKKMVKTKVVGRDIKVPMINRYRNPKQVGQDRLVGAYAALQLYGKPLIVVDLGTAITFDVVSKKGEYLGGVIVPGLRLSAESLFLKTALLPQINIHVPKNPVGRTTEESILSGLFYGYGHLCQGMVDLLGRYVGANRRFARTHVVMTGGHTQLMKKFVSPKIRIIDENLVFKGLYFLALKLIDR